MILYQNDTIFARVADASKSQLKVPLECNETCLHFKGCKFPKSCPVKKSTSTSKVKQPPVHLAEDYLFEEDL